MPKKRRRIRYTRQTVRRGRGGRYVKTGGRRESIRIPKAPGASLPRYVVLSDGTRLLTTSRRGRASLPLLEFLRDRGLLLPELVELDTARRIAVDSPEIDPKAVPPSWGEEQYEAMEESFTEELAERIEEEPESVEEAEAQEAEEAILDVMAETFEEELEEEIEAYERRSRAARKGWRTRRAKARRR